MGAALCLRESHESYGRPLRAVLDRDSAHEALVAIARRRAADDVALLEPLLIAAETRAYELLGLGSVHEYCARLFGWGGRQTRERLRVAKAMRSLPEMRERWAHGELTYTVVRELTRVATPAVELEWIDWATRDGVRRTGHEVQQVVMRHRRGARPSDAPAPFEEQRVRVVLEMSGSEASRLSEVRSVAAQRLGHSVDDETLAKMLFDAFLRGGDAGERESSPHQVKLTVCDRCGATERQAGAEGLVPVDPVVGAVALCDAQVLRAGERATQTVPPATRRAVLRRDEGKCAVPGCRHAAFVDVHHIERRIEGGGHEMGNLVSLCSVHHDAAHRGRLVVRRHEGELRFERADGRPYGTISGAADTTRCASASRHFEAIVAATGSERFAREALRPGAGDAGRSPESTARLAPRSQPTEAALQDELAPRSHIEGALREEVAGLLTSMGYRKREADWLLERALGGNDLPEDRAPSKVELLRAALRAGPPRVEVRKGGRRRR
ncbi:MAG: HNH endonuclease [Deltaproteobacteria bacterium]|nr:HNH endonuclease [Deltaproteobacteria bacterium]